MAVPGCSPEPGPAPGHEEIYLGDFWIDWYGPPEYTATRVDLGEGIYEDSYRQIEPQEWETDGCMFRRFSDTRKHTYRGLVLLAEWNKFYSYNNCNDNETVGETRFEYDYAPFTPQEIHQALMAGESFDTPYHVVVRVLGYDCVHEARPCSIERAFRIIGEGGGTEIMEDAGDYEAIQWKWRGESVVEHAAGTSKTLVFNRMGGQYWYDISREVIVLKRGFAEPGDSTPGHVIAAEHDGYIRPTRLGGTWPDIEAAHWARQWTPEFRSRP